MTSDDNYKTVISDSMNKTRVCGTSTLAIVRWLQPSWFCAAAAWSPQPLAGQSEACPANGGPC